MKNIDFTVQSIADSAWNLEETKLNLKFSPLDDDLGDRDLESTLQIARIWTEAEYLAVPDKIFNTFTIDIPWTNVQEQGIAGDQTDSYVLNWSVLKDSSTKVCMLEPEILNGNLQSIQLHGGNLRF